MASESRILVDITDNRTDYANVLSPSYANRIEKLELNNEKRTYAIYDLNEHFKTNSNATKFNMASIYQAEHNYQLNSITSSIYANRFFIDNGFFNGKIKCKITNRLARPIDLVYFESLPWQIRFYLHTLRIENDKNENEDELNLKESLLYYQPGKYKEKPYHLELKLSIPAKSTTTISFDLDKVFLKWTEYPPDANHGIYIGSSILVVQLDNQTKFRTTTEPLLIGLPTPDFSMPYNVICLVSTVISLCFAPIHNFTTRIVDVLKK